MPASPVPHVAGARTLGGGRSGASALKTKETFSKLMRKAGSQAEKAPAAAPGDNSEQVAIVDRPVGARMEEQEKMRRRRKRLLKQ